MSESPEAPEELPENFSTKVIAQLTIYLSQEDSKGKVKESKSQKMKEIVFTFLDNNYVEFLQMLLAKHLQDKYKVMQAFKSFEMKGSHEPASEVLVLPFWTCATSKKHSDRFYRQLKMVVNLISVVDVWK